MTASEYVPDRVYGPLPVPARRGGFGSPPGFERFLETKAISAVLDATHPFAHRISARTAQICRDRNLPYTRVLRPPWVRQAGDAWTEVCDEAAADIGQDARVFLTTGRATLEAFRDLTPSHLFVRQIQLCPLPEGFEEVH